MPVTLESLPFILSFYLKTIKKSPVLYRVKESIYCVPQIIINFKEREFYFHLYCVVNYQENGKMCISNDSCGMIVCRLDGFMVDYETGIICVPVENASI